MIRLYKYLIYRVYSWRLQQNDDNLAWSVIFLLSVVHFFQLLTIFFWLQNTFIQIILDFLQIDFSIYFLQLFSHALIIIFFTIRRDGKNIYRNTILKAKKKKTKEQQ